MMKLPIFQVDAFTSALFCGNPAAVVPLERWLPTHTMAAIAAENNLAETAFCVQEGESWGLRWFTPDAEVDLCGHATLACAHVLLTHGYQSGKEVSFLSQSGPLTVRLRGQLLELDFPSRPPQACREPHALAETLGHPFESVLAARDLFVVFPDEQTVARLQPDFTALAALDYMGVIVTAPGDQLDFISRFFAPKVGLPEDSVTGSAHCSLIPYWAKRLGKQQLQARQISKRGGDLSCELKGDRVCIAGNVVDYMSGQITLTESSCESN